MALFIPALAFAAQTIVTGALTSVGAKGLDAVVGNVLKIFDSNAGQKIPEKDCKLINVFNKELGKIDSEVTQLKNDLNSQISSIRSVLENISESQLYLAWSISNSNVLEHVTSINNLYSTYEELMNQGVKTGKAPDKDSLDNLADDILDANDGAGWNIAQLEAIITQTGVADSVLDQFRAMAWQAIVQGKNSYKSMLNAYMNYYSDIVQAQVTGTNLIVEANNMRENSSHETLQNLRDTLKSQELFFLRNVDAIVFAALEPGANDSGSWFTYDYFTANQAALAQGCYVTPYAPSEYAFLAEQLLAAVYPMLPGERRVAVWMKYPSEISSDISYESVNIEIGQSPYSSGISATRKDSWNVNNTSNYIATHCTRFVYESEEGMDSIKDGCYRMINLNDVYPIIYTSPYPQLKFQSDMYLQHDLVLSPQGPFQFMDFLPYAYPSRYAAQI